MEEQRKDGWSFDMSFPFEFPAPKKKKPKKCNCSRRRKTTSNSTVPYVNRPRTLDEIFPKITDPDPEPSDAERDKLYLKYFGKLPETTDPWILWEDMVSPENDITTDHSNDAFDWSALQEELLKIAGEVGIPPSGSEQYDIAMQRLEKNTVFMILSESLKAKKERIREDSSLGPILEQIQSGGPDVMKRYWNDKDLLYKLGVALGEILLEHDKSFTDTLATAGVSEEKVFQPVGDPTKYDWDNLRARLFVMLLA